MVKYGRALYYPTIEFQNTEWFKLSTLFYEGLDRIVPKHVYYEDNAIVKQINDELNYIKNIDPKDFAKDASQRFYEYFKNNIVTLEEKAFKNLVNISPGDKFRVHYEKVDPNLFSKLEEFYSFEKEGDWYKFSSTMGQIYMSFLANEIGSKNMLGVISDKKENQVLLNYAQIDSEIMQEDLSFNLASLAIQSYLPKDIQNVSVKQLVDFRKKHEPERIRFYSAVNNIVSDLNNIKDISLLTEILHYRKKEIDISVDDLKLSLQGLGVEVQEGVMGISLPSALQLVPSDVEYSASIKTIGAIASLVILGSRSVINKRKIKRESPYSYLLSVSTSNLGKEQLLKQLLSGKVFI